MRIGILTQYFPPEMGAPQARLSELAFRLQKRGHKIVVITAMPNYPTGRVFPEYRRRFFARENMNGLRVIRTPIYPSKSTSLAVRLISYMSFVATSLLMGTWFVGKLDVLLVESPPLFLGLSGIPMARLTRSRLVFMVSDIWPDVAVRMGDMISEKQARILEKLEGFIYRKYVDSVEVDETLRDMRELRLRSISYAGSDERMRRRNLKNGPGGIRDIEFLVQAIQNLYGAQYPEFRRGNLFEVLRRIRQSGLMSERDYTLLIEGYGFLRRLEHRIQMDDMQRYHLPQPGEDLETLAVGLGFEKGEDLEQRLSGTMAAIHSIFQIVFRTNEPEESISKLRKRRSTSHGWGASPSPGAGTCAKAISSS